MPLFRPAYVPSWRYRRNAYGPDVSHWKPITSWKALLGTGASFLGMKATEGNKTLDSTLRQHRDSFRASPLLLGIYYHFARSGDPTAQAERLLAAVGDLRHNERLCLDLEVVPVMEPREGSTLSAANLLWIHDFVTTLRDEYPDRPVLIYTSRRIWRMLDDPQWIEATKELHLWVPRYNTVEPRLPRPWDGPDILEGAGWTFWQWTDGEAPAPLRTPGIGRCDMNVFRGTVAELKAYAQPVDPVKPSERNTPVDPRLGPPPTPSQ